MKGKESMLNEQTFDKLYGLKLFGMAEGFKEQLQQQICPRLGGKILQTKEAKLPILGLNEHSFFSCECTKVTPNRCSAK